MWLDFRATQVSDTRKSALGKSFGEAGRFFQKIKESISHFKGKTNKLLII